MNLQAKSLSLAFIVALLLTLLVPAVAPAWRLSFLVPFLIISFYQKTYITCLWYAFSCGLILDLVLSQERFGLYGLNFTIAAALLHPQKRHFFADSLSTLPIMTTLFSMISTLIQVILMNGLERDLSLGWKWVATDLFFMPIFDGVYSFALFVAPFALFGKRQRRGRDYFIEA